MSHLILTGASGFVGSHVLRHVLTETDWTIACPVSFRHKGLPARITSALQERPDWWARVDIVHCDLSAPVDHLTFASLGGDRCDFLLNVASESHVDRSISDPVPFVTNNVSLVLNVLEAARQMPQLKMLLHMSTDEVYGPAPGDYCHREWDAILPSNPYSASKAAQEAIAISYWRTFSVPVVLTNTMNIVGETQDVEKMVPKAIRSVLSGEPMTVHADAQGKPGSRFYLHARNLADAWLWLVRNHTPRMYPDHDRPSRFNIVGEREVDNGELVEMIADILDCEPQMEFVDFHGARPGHDRRYALDGTLISQAGWKAPVNFDESLRRTVEWTVAHPEWLA